MYAGRDGRPCERRGSGGPGLEAHMRDEDAIRNTIGEWLKATKNGDSSTLASILDDDVLFVVPGRPPFGKKDFFAGDLGKPFRFESKVDIREVVVHGDWALTRVDLAIEITVAEGAAPMKLAGPTMSVWRRMTDGRWAIWRDANMVAPVAA
jgi:uncharacterized protein (TIGR02246 family)